MPNSKKGPSKTRRLVSLRLFKRIVVAVDGSRSSSRALQIAARLAKTNKAELTVVSVVPRPPYTFAQIPSLPASGLPAIATVPMTRLADYYEHASKTSQRCVDEAELIARTQNVRVDGQVLSGYSSTVNSITEYAKKRKADLIVVGTRGSGGFRRLLHSSVSNGVVTNGASSVLVVR